MANVCTNRKIWLYSQQLVPTMSWEPYSHVLAPSLVKIFVPVLVKHCGAGEAPEWWNIFHTFSTVGGSWWCGWKTARNIFSEATIARSLALNSPDESSEEKISNLTFLDHHDWKEFETRCWSGTKRGLAPGNGQEESIDNCHDIMNSSTHIDKRLGDSNCVIICHLGLREEVKCYFADFVRKGGEDPLNS